MPLPQPLRLLVFFLALSGISTTAAVNPSGTIPCENDDICALIAGSGSTCTPNGLCSNPFVSGCLQNLLAEELAARQGSDAVLQKNRVCNSDDDIDTILEGLCLPPPWEYMEIRILTGNWESSLLTAWALQIFLTELLQIPTSIESSDPNRQGNFYHATNQFDYGTVAYDYAALTVGNDLGDCQLGREQQQKGEEGEGDAVFEGTLTDSSTVESTYTSCAHIMPEIWNGQDQNLQSLLDQEIIERPQLSGVVGRFTWYIPKFWAEAHPEWTHYAGWTNATKVAETYPRPVNWQTYCDEYSLNNCATPNEVASRYPVDTEGSSYYQGEPGDGFRGYFDMTDANRCSDNDSNVNGGITNCTGFFADFVCDWSTFAFQQIYHLGVALESNGPLKPNGGYNYGEKLQMWEAASASQTPVVMNWYKPDPNYQWLRGSPGEMHEVQLPIASPLCLANRVDMEGRCTEDIDIRAGLEVGGCGPDAQTLKNALVHNFQQGGSSSMGKTGRSSMEEKDDANILESPAYDAIKKFQLSEIDIEAMLDHWHDRRRRRLGSEFEGTLGTDPRHAVCKWTVDNIASHRTMLPFSYPRTLTESNAFDTSYIFWVGIGIGIFAFVCVCFMSAIVYWFREKPVFKLAQLPFLSIVLFGLMLISAGAATYAMEPDETTCVARIWLITMGYTLELIPLIVKVQAMNKMMQASKKMKKIRITRRSLFVVVGAFCALVGLYLTIWTVVDPPTKGRQMTIQLSDEQVNSESEPWVFPVTSIEVSYYCRAGYEAWYVLMTAWQFILLVACSVLALQTRQLHKAFNESRTLAIMIYGQTTLALFQIVILMMEDSGMQRHYLDAIRSFLYSLDALLALTIYFGSKLVKVITHQENVNEGEYYGMSQRDSVARSRIMASVIRASSAGSHEGTVAQIRAAAYNSWAEPSLGRLTDDLQSSGEQLQETAGFERRPVESFENETSEKGHNLRCIDENESSEEQSTSSSPRVSAMSSLVDQEELVFESWADC